jgi:hypothetical protein
VPAGSAPNVAGIVLFTSFACLSHYLCLVYFVSATSILLVWVTADTYMCSFHFPAVFGLKNVMLP